MRSWTGPSNNPTFAHAWPLFQHLMQATRGHHPSPHQQSGAVAPQPLPAAGKRARQTVNSNECLYVLPELDRLQAFKVVCGHWSSRALPRLSAPQRPTKHGWAVHTAVAVAEILANQILPSVGRPFSLAELHCGGSLPPVLPLTIETPRDSIAIGMPDLLLASDVPFIFHP